MLYVVKAYRWIVGDHPDTLLDAMESLAREAHQARVEIERNA